MQVIAVATPSHPDWRWRIVNYAGEMVEESYEAFATIALALAAGGRRMREVNRADGAAPAIPFGAASPPRAR
jgi:hypothetical protein